MAVMCTACGLEIPLGHESTSISCGIVKASKKSGRVFHEEHTSDPICATVHCYIRYLAQKSQTDPGHLIDSMVNMVRDQLEPDLRAEVADEFTQDKMEEMRDEVADEFRRTCAVCAEELEEYCDEVNEEDNSPPTQQPVGWFQPAPLR